MGRVLVVDDMSTIRRIVKAVETAEGHEVWEADSGQAALNSMSVRSYDLVLSDWNMPGMTGTELVRAMKADPALAGVPVVMLTAEADRSKIMELAAIGVAGYVLKPFKPETLIRALRATLKGEAK